ncbi:MAG: SRPBCC family protein [Myxococcota bacterium]
MKVSVSTRINRPIDDVWALVADDFTSIQTWSESVITSNPLADAPSVDGSPLGGRYCTFTDDPEGFGAREQITKYDKKNYRLEFDVEPVNAPGAIPLRKNQVTLTLTKLGPTETEIEWVASPELKPHGYLMYPMLKVGLAKSFRGILAELKTYAESQDANAQRPHLGAVG